MTTYISYIETFEKKVIFHFNYFIESILPLTGDTEADKKYRFKNNLSEIKTKFEIELGKEINSIEVSAYENKHPEMGILSNTLKGLKYDYLRKFEYKAKENVGYSD